MTASRTQRKVRIGVLSLAIAQALATAPVVAQTYPSGFGGSTNVTAPVVTGTPGAETVTVNVTGPRAYAEWNDFSLDNGQTFRVTNTSTPDAYIFVNRVTGANFSSINGRVEANGNFWLLNPNGIMVGSTGVFDVGGLMLSTATQLNGEDESTNGAAFLAGNSPAFTLGGAANSIVVQPGAQLLADIGTIALLANQVNVGGTVNAGGGEIAVIGARGLTVSFDGDLNAFTTLTMDAGGNQVVGAQIDGGDFTAARTVIAAAGMTSGQGNVLLSNGGAPFLTFNNGDIELHSRDGDVVNQRRIDAPGDLSITAGRIIDFSTGGSAVVAGDYAVAADDFYAGVFSADLTGIDSSLSITDTAGGLYVGSLTAPGDINLSTTNGGGLTISNWDPSVPLQSGGDVRLTTTGGGDLELAGNLSTGATGTLWLDSSSGIRQTGGVASTRYVSAQAVNGIQLDGANLFGTGSFRNSGAGGVAVRSDSAGFWLGAAQTGSGDVTVTAANGIVLDGAVVDTDNGNARIDANVSVAGPNIVSASGTVTFNGAIDAGASIMGRNLEVTSGAGTTFNGSVGGTSALDTLIVNGAATFRGTGVHTLQGLSLDDVSIAATGTTFDMSVQSGNFVAGDIAADPFFNGTMQLSSPLIQAGSISAPNASIIVDGGTAGGGYTTLGAIDSGGTVTVQGVDVDIAGTVQAAGNIDMTGRDLQVDTVRSTGGSVQLASTTGPLYADVLGAAQSITVTGGSLVNIGRADASGNLSITATGGNLQLGSGSGTFAMLTASGDIAVTGALDTSRLAGGAGGAAAFTGDNTIDTLGAFTADSLQLRNVSSLSIMGTVDVGAGDARFDVVNENFQIDPTGQVRGGNIAVNATNFYNTSGADGLVASGHWVVYQRSPSFAPMYDGLDSGATAIWGQTIDSLAPSSVTGNRYVFGFQPTLTFTSTDIAKTYGTDLTGAAGGLFTISGLQAGVAGAYLGDTLSSVFSGSPLVSSSGFGPRASVAGGPYAIVLSNGTLVSTAGYRFAFNNTGGVMVDPLGIVGTVTVDPKVYDGTTTGAGTVTLNGVLSGDAVGTTGTTFTFDDANAGAGRTVNIGGTTLTGADAGNYTLTVPASVLADILQRAITATVIVDGKTYDGTTNATGSITLDGVIAGDTVGTMGTTYTFADRNAGTGKVVNVSSTTLTGADAGNYSLTVPASVLADILQKSITATVLVDGKTYDGTTNATGSITLDGVVTGDTVGTAGTTYTFADRNAGTGKTANISGTTLTGADAGNYTLTVPATALGEIVRRVVTGTAFVQNKTYDGTTAATGAISLDGVLSGDTVQAQASFEFADPNAGAGKAVELADVALTGGDALNYTVVMDGAALADILQRAITVTADPQSKTSGAPDPALTWTVTQGSLVAGDALSGSLARAPGEAVGTYAIEQGTLNPSSNYRLTFVGSTLTITELTQGPYVSGRRDDGVSDLLVSLEERTSSHAPDTGRLEVIDARAECGGGDPEPVCASAPR